MKIPYFLADLELDRTADERAIRRAYARKLKRIDAELYPVSFQALREAYEAALSWVQAQNHSLSTREESLDPQSDERSGTSMSLAEIDRVEATEFSGVHASGESPSSGQHHSPPCQPDDAAGEVFAEFVANLGPRFQDLAQVRRDLERSLNDPRLINLEARELFEWRLICWLASGWQPGNEALIGVAASRFDWEKDRKRLHRFGRPGDILDYALLQLTAFKQQDTAHREQQLEAIRKLRSSAPPTRRDLLTFMPWVEEAAARFPALLPLITNADNIARWRELDGQVPAWRRKLSFRRSPDKAGGQLSVIAVNEPPMIGVYEPLAGGQTGMFSGLRIG